MPVQLNEPVAIPAGLQHHPRTAHHRRVSVAGVGGEVGTTTIAVALDATDRGVCRGRLADVLVCKATGDSLIRVDAPPGSSRPRPATGR